MHSKNNSDCLFYTKIWDKLFTGRIYQGAHKVTLLPFLEKYKYFALTLSGKL